MEKHTHEMSRGLLFQPAPAQITPSDRRLSHLDNVKTGMKLKHGGKKEKLINKHEALT